jgi:transposase InsO family protein
MSAEGLVSCYNKKKRPKSGSKVNESSSPNIIAREFDGRSQYEAIVSDTSYITISNKWHYLCPMLDLSNRAILGSSVSNRRDESLVVQSIYDMQIDLRNVGIFHTDRGSEFNSKTIDKILEGFNIRRSLSKKGNPIDNAVIESFFKTIKIEFINRYKFTCLESFKAGWARYVHWYNYKRRHSSLGYRPPMG